MTERNPDHARRPPEVRHLPGPVPPGGPEPDAGARARPAAHRAPRRARLRRGLVRRAPLGRLRDHRLPRGLHRRRRPAHQAHPPGHRGVVAALPPPLHAGRPPGAARPPDPGPPHDRRRPGRAALRRLHDGHRPGQAARHDGGGARGHPAAARGQEPVTMETDWFKLVGARLQMRPYQRPYPEVAVAAQVSPAGPRAAGKFGCSLLSIGATSAGGFDILGATGTSWRSGRPSSAPRSTAASGAWSGPCTSPTPRSRPSPTSPSAWRSGSTTSSGWPPALAPDTTNFESLVDALNASGFAVIGTVDDAIAQIERLRTQSGGFGTFLLMGHEWADTAATRHSYELFARYVAPQFQDSSRTLTASRDWAAENRPSSSARPGTPSCPPSSSTTKRKRPRRPCLTVHCAHRHPRADPGQRDRAPRRHRRPGRRPARRALPRLPRALVLLAPPARRAGRGRLPRLAPDLRGYGGSSHPEEVGDYGSDKLTGDLCGLLDHYGYDRPPSSARLGRHGGVGDGPAPPRAGLVALQHERAVLARAGAARRRSSR
jgi:alkanesulfonate monooxygenase SsuD/methylene tetrahydromethanopterin reductase-like flavin-dependent oxidoreductase (luciferase family)